MRDVARVLFCVALLGACTSGHASGDGRTEGAPELTDTVIQSGLSVPWDVALAPDGRMFVTERMGDILMFESAQPNAKRVATTKVPDVHAMGEAGLMGVTLDPSFGTNGLLYVCASRLDGGEWRNDVLRYKAGADSITFDGDVIRGGPQAAAIHDGCRLRFGPDAKLWVTMGENGNGRLAQDPRRSTGRSSA